MGELEDTEVDTMMNTALCAQLKRVRDFDGTCYDAIIIASGKIPRELGQFAACLDVLSHRIHEELKAPAKKKLKLDIDAAIAKKTKIQFAEHQTALSNVLRKNGEQGVTVLLLASSGGARHSFWKEARGPIRKFYVCRTSLYPQLKRRCDRLSLPRRLFTSNGSWTNVENANSLKNIPIHN